MKILLPFILITSSILLSIGMQRPIQSGQGIKKNFGLTADSGYILKKQAIALLSKTKHEYTYGPDKLDLNRTDITEKDTIGKYYVLKNGNYIACVHDITHPERFSCNILMELSPDFSIIKSEMYLGGLHQCCWDNHYNGFKKHGDYFSLAICGTGSGFCSSEIYLFKSLHPQGHTTITENVWSSWCVGGKIACNLKSKMEIKNDTIIMHYTKEHLKEGRNGKYKVTDKEKFDIKYVAHEQGWVALDSTKIHEFPD